MKLLRSIADPWWGKNARSVHVAAAVDVDGRALQVARFVAGEEDEYRGDLVGGCRASERDSPDDRSLDLVGRPDANVGVDGTRSDRVDSHASGAEFTGKR